MEKSKWAFSNDLTHLNAAQSWGCPTPSSYFKLPKEDRIEILAWYEVTWKMRAVDDYERAEKSKRESKKRQRKR